MRRRDFIAALGGAAAWPRAARAQQSGRRPRIGVLLVTNPQADPNTQAFRRALRDLGYVEGANVEVEYRFAEGHLERLPTLAGELVRTQPDVLFALGGDVARAAIAATHSIPVVFASSADPVQLGFVSSLARPGGNATGVSFLLDELASKRLELLKEMAPKIARVAFVYDPDHVDSELREAQRSAPALGVQLQTLVLKGPADLDQVLPQASGGRAEAVYVVSSRQTVRSLSRLVNFAAERRVPLAGGWGAWARAGGLFSYGPNLDDMVRRATGYVDRILKGAKPADLPVQQPTRFELILNLKAAKALGLNVAPSLVARADEVIE